jgi:signal transduction histidine kinase
MLREPTVAPACDSNRLETLEREILIIADHERQRVGHELHDGLCQSLTGIAALTAVLSRHLATSAGPGAAAAATEILRLLNQTIGQARDLAHGLCPVGLNGVELTDALDALARNITRGQGAFCAFVEDGSRPELHPETTAHLVRIAQEAVRNATTHGRAGEIEIRLTCTDRWGSLIIRDNGLGLAEQHCGDEGIGLHTMGYRARAIGGSLEVAAQCGRGVEVTCVFPLPKREQSPEGADDVRGRC